MEELIKITKSAGGRDVVSARELYNFLGLESGNWSRWYEKNIVKNEFVAEFVDYQTLLIERNGNETKDFAITLDFAKRLAMMTRSEKGEQVRTYFLKCEKELTPLKKEEIKIPTLIEQTRLLLQALEEKEVLIAKALLDAPKVEFYDTAVQSETTFDFQEAASILKLRKGRNTLFKRLREHKVLMFDNLPYAHYLALQYFEVIQSLRSCPKTFKPIIEKQTRFTQRGLDWLFKNREKFDL